MPTLRKLAFAALVIATLVLCAFILWVMVRVRVM